MKLKFTQKGALTTFFNWIFWVPAVVFYTHLLLSTESDLTFLKPLRIPFLCVLIMLLILCIIVRKTTIHLAKHYPIANNYFKRVGMQFLYGFLIPLSAVLVLICLYCYATGNNLVQNFFLGRQIFIAAFFLYIFNGVYVFIELENQFVRSDEVQVDERMSNDKFLVYRNGYYAPINLIEIALVYQSEKINWVTTFDNEKYILDLSLIEAFRILGTKQFFMINRREIIHKDIVENFRSGKCGKIDLKLNIQAITTTVSKDKAMRFRKWINVKNIY